MRGTLDVVALERALRVILARHEVLRTHYVARSGRPIQVVSEAHDWLLPLLDISSLPESEREDKARKICLEDFERPFSLASDLMMRAKVLRMSAQDHLLLLTLHHIASDGWSCGILTRELNGLYNAFSAGKGSPLPELPIQYADYATWQRDWLQGEALQRQEAYWQSQLAGSPPVLLLPSDYPREEAASHRGAAHRFRTPTGSTEGLKKLCIQERVTPFMALLAAYYVLLYRWSGVSDLLVGTDVANRTEPQTEGMIGFFLNHLVLRAHMDGDPTFRELLGRIRDVCLGAYAHQDLPFDKLVELLHPERRTTHSPIFQVLFVIENMPRGTTGWSGLTVNAVRSELMQSKFDLSLFMNENDTGYGGIWVYRTELFSSGTVRRLTGQYLNVLDQVLRNPDMSIEDVELASEAEAPSDYVPKVRAVGRPINIHRKALVIDENA